MEIIRPRRRGLTLIELLILIVAIGVLACILIPVEGYSVREHRIIRCASNQRQLYQMLQVYKIRHKGSFPEAKGSAFWLALQKTSPPLIEADLAEIYFCPVKGENPRPGNTDFRGPSNPMSQHRDADPVCADIVGNHDEENGINVVSLAGDVQRVYPDAPLWKACDTLLSK